ncbi:MAG: PH domain-containing protein, partial [Anaerolineae bacterium]
MNDAMGQADHVVQVFETGRLSSWTEILGWVFIGSVLVGLLVFQQWLLAGILGLGLLLFPLLGRHEIYQRVAVEETGIRYRRALNRERRLYWSHVSGARLRGDWLELLG